MLNSLGGFVVRLLPGAVMFIVLTRSEVGRAFGVWCLSILVPLLGFTLALVILGVGALLMGAALLTAGDFLARQIFGSART